MTKTVTETMRERLDCGRRPEAAGLADRLSAIGHDCADRLKAPCCYIDHADLLYGKDGLPQ